MELNVHFVCLFTSPHDVISQNINIFTEPQNLGMFIVTHAEVL